MFSQSELKRNWHEEKSVEIVLDIYRHIDDFRYDQSPKNAVAQAPEPHLEKVDERVLNSISTNGISDCVSEMTEKADLSKAYSITDWNERGWDVYDTLREVAARTQKPVIEILENRGFVLDQPRLKKRGSIHFEEYW